MDSANNRKTNFLICTILVLSSAFIYFVGNCIMLNSRLVQVEQSQIELSTANQTIQTNYDTLEENYSTLQTNYDELSTNYLQLENNYDELQNNYTELQTNYNELQTNYEELGTAIIGMNNDGPKLTKYGGVNYHNGHKETYYNLPMAQVVRNAKNRGIGGNYWVRKDGAKMLGIYVMVAADQSKYPYGSIVNTSLGDGIVVDTGSFIAYNSNQFDIATNW